MKELIKHFMQCNRDEIIKKSILHCHCSGMHSVMFSDTPGKRIRMFYAEHNHDMWKNDPCYTGSQSIAFHPHHCDLTLIPVKGNVFNFIVTQANIGTIPLKLGAYSYNSQISKGKIGFTKLTNDTLYSQDFNRISVGDSKFMKGAEIHTVYVPRFERAAWVVVEGSEDPDYTGYCWSNADLVNEDFSGLYKPMTEKKLDEIIDWVLKD